MRCARAARTSGDLWENDGHVNIISEYKKKINEPEGNAGDQSLAKPKSKIQPKQKIVVDNVLRCVRVATNNDNHKVSIGTRKSLSSTPLAFKKAVH